MRFDLFLWLHKSRIVLEVVEIGILVFERIHVGGVVRTSDCAINVILSRPCTYLTIFLILLPHTQHAVTSQVYVAARGIPTIV